MTEQKDRNADHWQAQVFYDAHCPICRSTVARSRGIFEARQIGFYPLQDPGVLKLLHLHEGQPPNEMKLVDRTGRILGGASAVAWLCRQVGWLWPLGLLMDAPVFNRIAQSAYRWIASNRYCLGDLCSLPPTPTGTSFNRHHAATTFLEMP